MYVLKSIIYECRQWKLENQRSPSIAGGIIEWMRDTICIADLDMNDPNEADTMYLAIPPQEKEKRYARMQAYGNHWLVVDDKSDCLQTFDSGVACFVGPEYEPGSGEDYVALVKDIIVFDYGPLINTHVILFMCEWQKWHDNMGNNMYKRDDNNFLVVKWKHKAGKTVIPYAFLQQCVQVFFADDNLRYTGSE